MKLSRRSALVAPLAAGTGMAGLLRTRGAGAATDAPAALGDARLMQGPMLGAVYADGVDVWGRASDRYDLAIAVSRRADMSDPVLSQPRPVGPGTDYTGVVRLRGLEPATRYHYRVFLNGAEDDTLRRLPPLSFRTAPAAGSRTRFRLAFGSCARYAEDPVQPIWSTVAALRPDLFFWLGDNVYADTVNPGTLAEEYRRQRDVLSYRPLAGELPQLAIWDDHDFGINDYDRRNPIRAESLAVFKRYWANPAYGLPDTPGVFFDYHYGGVDFFFLDGRYHRDPNGAPDGPGKTQLGAAQRDWLKDRLQASRAPFKVLVSGGGWSSAKGPGGDSWAAFLHERDALLEFIRRESISGVIALSGDTHVAELNCVPFSARGGYDFYDLTSSPLAQNPTDSWLFRKPELRIRPVFFESPNVGLIDFDLTGEPTLTYNVYDTGRRKAWADFRIEARELRNGVASHVGRVVERKP